MKKWKWTLFALMLMIQLAIPLTTVSEHYINASRWTAYRFKSIPYDPRDILQGHYMNLNASIAVPDFPKQLKLDNERKYYATLSKDEHGFAKIVKLTREKPLSGDFLAVEVRENGDHYIAQFPFERYYLNADVAQALDRDRTLGREMVLTVAVGNGGYIVKTLTINGLSPEQYIKAKQ